MNGHHTPDSDGFEVVEQLQSEHDFFNCSATNIDSKPDTSDESDDECDTVPIAVSNKSRSQTYE